MKIAIIGAGNVGGNLGARLAQAGASVAFGVREGKELASEGGDVQVMPLKQAADWGDMVFLAVPGKVAVEVAAGLAPLEGKILVDCTNPVAWDQGPVWDPPEAGSITAAIAQALPQAQVLKAFNTFGAEFHGDPQLADTCIDVWVAGDSDEAKEKLADLAERAGFRTIDSGPLRNASLLENVALLWIHLATVGEQGRDFGFKMLRK